MNDDLDNILKKADSDNTFSKPLKRVFCFRIEFKSFLDISIFYKEIHRLGLENYVKLPNESLIKGRYDISINNQDNFRYSQVKALVKVLNEKNIKIR